MEISSIRRCRPTQREGLCDLAADRTAPRRPGSWRKVPSPRRPPRRSIRPSDSRPSPSLLSASSVPAPRWRSLSSSRCLPSSAECRPAGPLRNVAGSRSRSVRRLMAGSRRVTGGSSLLRAQRPPSGLRRRCQRLHCSGGFLSGARRASPVPNRPFPACHHHYPAGIASGLSPPARTR